MVAYSFQPMFVDPIRVGLGLLDDVVRRPLPTPKLHTVRAESRKRHARPGEEVQLFCQQRTRQCFLIGRARCTKTPAIVIKFPLMLVGGPVGIDEVEVEGMPSLVTAAGLDAFAVSDGFDDWAALRAFWREHHRGVNRFTGRMICWEPKT